MHEIEQGFYLEIQTIKKLEHLIVKKSFKIYVVIVYVFSRKLPSSL